MLRLTSFLWSAGLLAALHSSAAIRLPAIIADNMVLQQRSDVPLWGSASHDATVYVITSWDHKAYTTPADHAGHWRITVRTPAAGGPYEISFSDGKKLVLKNILIGEVWVCSGQSNMEISLKGYANQPVLNANDILADAYDPQLRLFHVQRAVSNAPVDDCKGAWEVSSPGSAASFSAVGFQFAKKLQEILKVPVGIIEASWGGTPIEAWMDKESLRAFPAVKTPVENDTAKADRLRPTCLFNGMIAPVAGFGIKGFIWYQGETNVPHPSGYDQLMNAMISEWRKLWGRDTLPFYYVQIAPWKYTANRDSVALLREAQQKAQSEIPHTGMAVSIDAGNEFTIHPPDKTVISKRLLYWALGDAYGEKGIAYLSPYYKSMKKTGSTIAVSFSDAPNGFTSFDKEITGFEIAGADHVFHPAQAKIFRNTIQVHSDEVPDPVAVRYAFRDWVTGNLYNTAGLPVAPFRTDDW